MFGGPAPRWPLSLRGQTHLQHFIPGQLDYELVARWCNKQTNKSTNKQTYKHFPTRDQRMEAQLTKVPRRVKVSLRCA